MLGTVDKRMTSSSEAQDVQVQSVQQDAAYFDWSAPIPSNHTQFRIEGKERILF